jgi:endonuclease/exonuclease/phosphatase (EEP) superfamily protein YafD
MNRSKALAALLVCIVLASHFGKLHFYLELLSHFRVHYAAIALFFATFFAFRRQASWSILSIITAAVNLVPVITLYTAEDEWRVSDTGASLAVLLSNVQQRNRDYDRLIRLVDQEQPDILGLIEVDAEWLSNLETVRQQYKFRVERPRADLWGLALYSKLPVTESESVLFGQAATPAIVATIDAAEGELEVILAHPRWPLKAESSARRNAQLREMARYVRAANKQILLLADLNTTMWSPYYREFEEESALTNARAGYGIGATWPPIRAIGIPIDHILVTEPSRVGNFRVHESIHSDHLPISADVRILPRPSERLATSANK